MRSSSPAGVFVTLLCSRAPELTLKGGLRSRDALSDPHQYLWACPAAGNTRCSVCGVSPEHWEAFWSPRSYSETRDTHSRFLLHRPEDAWIIYPQISVIFPLLVSWPHRSMAEILAFVWSALYYLVSESTMSINLCDCISTMLTDG